MTKPNEHLKCIEELMQDPWFRTKMHDRELSALRWIVGEVERLEAMIQLMTSQHSEMTKKIERYDKASCQRYDYMATELPKLQAENQKLRKEIKDLKWKVFNLESDEKTCQG